MNYVLDASVAVAAVRPKEPHHAAARSRLTVLFQGQDAIVVPALFSIEVTSALARSGLAAGDIVRYVARLLAGATVVTLGPRRAEQVGRVAMSTRLRAGDAIYVWLAAREGIPLVTADREIVERGRAVCQIQPP